MALCLRRPSVVSRILRDLKVCDYHSESDKHTLHVRVELCLSLKEVGAGIQSPPH
jgi:hypothetical protein